MTVGTQPGVAKKLSAAEKKRARRQKAKLERKEFKSATHQVHADLHKSQDLESGALGKAGRRKQDHKHEQLIRLDDGENSVVVEYVAEPFSTLQDLKTAADEAAVASNPYEGINGLEMSETDGKTAILSELDRIAKHFAPETNDQEDAEDNGPTVEVVAGTDAVVTTGKDDAKAIAQKEAMEEAGLQ
jgi:hypothetical protein